MNAPFMILLTSDSAINDTEKYGSTITWVDILHDSNPLLAGLALSRIPQHSQLLK